MVACASYLPVLTSCFSYFFLIGADYFSFSFLTQSKTALNEPIDIWVNCVPFYLRALARMLWEVGMHVKAFGKLQQLHMLSSGKSLMCWFFFNTREMWITILICLMCSVKAACTCISLL